MKFGVPNQRKQRVEKYPDTAIITLAVDEGKGKAKSIILNSKAVELLGLGEKKGQVAFSFDNGVAIMNAEQQGIPEEFGENVTKNYPRKVNNKRIYEYISKSLDLDNSVDNEFSMTSRTEEGINFFALTLGVVQIEEGIHGTTLDSTFPMPTDTMQEQDDSSSTEVSQETEPVTF